MIVEPKDVVLKNGVKVQLRSPRPSEAELLLQHLRISHTEAYRNLNQTADYWQKFSATEEEKILADFEISKSKFVVNAFYRDKVIGGLGFVGGFGDFLKHTGRLGMSIQKAYCNTGLGTEMLRYTLSVARIAGFHRAELTVRTYNEPGVSLYEKVGFQRVGLLKDAAFIDNEYVDEYLYELILD